MSLLPTSLSTCRVLLASAFVVAIGLAASGCRQPDHIQVEPKHPRFESLSGKIAMTAKVMSGDYHHAKKRVSWSSRDEDIIAVDEWGNLTPVSAGIGTLEARYGDLVAELLVEVDTVVGLETEVDEVVLSYDDVSPKKPEIRVLGYGGKLLRSRLPSYTSENSRICRVDGRGQFWPGNRGETTITVSAGSASHSITCRVE